MSALIFFSPFSLSPGHMLFISRKTGVKEGERERGGWGQESSKTSNCLLSPQTQSSLPTGLYPRDVAMESQRKPAKERCEVAPPFLCLSAVLRGHAGCLGAAREQPSCRSTFAQDTRVVMWNSLDAGISNVEVLSSNNGYLQWLCGCKESNKTVPHPTTTTTTTTLTHTLLHHGKVLNFGCEESNRLCVKTWKGETGSGAQDWVTPRGTWLTGESSSARDGSYSIPPGCGEFDLPTYVNTALDITHTHWHTSHRHR